MSYKTELQSNNVDLQGILDKVNALPEMEEAPELPTLSNPAMAAQILSGYEVLDQHGIKLTGIMEDNGAVSQALNAGESYTIPAGYHNGSGKVTGNSLASQTSANAAAGDILSGKTAWVNGTKITGNLVPATVSVGTITSGSGNPITIPGASTKNFIVFKLYNETKLQLNWNHALMVAKVNGNTYYIYYDNNNRWNYRLNSDVQISGDSVKLLSQNFQNLSSSNALMYVTW